ncbi:MAG TPA: MEDS domain-containing protein [Solirubrobacteraceae bacterium]|nr:MEDS domain-containing protein [Solirubrobacteraceae bacterium]
MPAVADIGHAVQFYREDAELFDTVATFLADGIRAGDVSIVIATEPHLRGFDSALVAAGLDPVAARADGLLVSLDADVALARVIRNGRLDRAAFASAMDNVMQRAADSRRPVRMFGEMVSLLWNAGDVIGAIELETLCNQLRREMRLSMLCGYHGESLWDDSHADALSAVCRLHSAVLGHFSDDATAPGEARRLVGQVLTQWGHGQELSDSVALVVSELATNAVTHAQSPFSVLARSDQQVIRISVRDASSVIPELRQVGPEGAGMGLRMVDAIAGAWGVEVTGGGKAVWAQLALEP